MGHPGVLSDLLIAELVTNAITTNVRPSWAFPHHTDWALLHFGINSATLPLDY